VRWDPADAALRAVALVPARTLADVAKTMSAGTPVTIAFGTRAPDGTDAEREPRPADGMISFAGGNRRLTARLIGGEFIKYRSRFPAEFGSRALLPAASFTEAVRRVSLVADRTTPVRLAFDAESVVIEAHTDGRARAVETVPVEFGGGERVISFSPHYLLDGLTAAAAPGLARPHGAAHEGEDEEPPADPGQIRLEFSTAAKPALISWAGDEGPDPETPSGTPAFRYLVVPLRVPARA
jgi:DNA polymerase-3 subunit beta